MERRLLKLKYKWKSYNASFLVFLKKDCFQHSTVISLLICWRMWTTNNCFAWKNRKKLDLNNEVLLDYKYDWGVIVFLLFR